MNYFLKLNKLLKRIFAPVTIVRLRKSGHMTNVEMTNALDYTRDSSLMRALEEIRSRLDDEIMSDAFTGTDNDRMKALSRIEGVNEFYKNILIFRDGAEEKRRQA
jgi:hypothetical protein